MNELALKIIKPFVGALLILALLFIARQQGYSTGYSDANAEHQKADIAALNNAIVNLNVSVKKAGEQNLELHKTINARKKADQQSTKVFVNELNATAHLRTQCMFDDSIMQKLHTAASAADQAASGGLVERLPSRDPPR